MWLVCAVVVPSPLLAEVPECDSPPLLAEFRCRWWWVFLATPGWGRWLRLPTTPGWGPMAAVCVVACPSWLRVLVAVPRHSWLGCAGRGGGRFRGVGWGVSRDVCVCGAARARGGCAGVCVVCSWWWCGCGCVFRVCWCPCVCVCACVVCGGCFPWLGLAGGVGVGLAGVCCGWSLATPGGCS